MVLHTRVWSLTQDLIERATVPLGVQREDAPIRRVDVAEAEYRDQTASREGCQRLAHDCDHLNSWLRNTTLPTHV